MALLVRYWYFVAIAALVIALGVQSSRLDNRTEQRDTARAFGRLMVDATREASGNPKLTDRDAPAQIAALGRSLKNVTGALEDLAKRVDAISTADLARQRAAREQLGRVQGAIAQRDKAIARLQASAARPRAPGEKCQPSQTLEDLWK